MHRLAVPWLVAGAIACTSQTALAPDAPPADADIDIRTPPDTGVRTVCDEAREHSDFVWIGRVLAYYCATVGCHTGTTATAELQLDEGYARESLVGVPSSTQPGWTRVTPGSIDTSYLAVALGRTPGPPPSVGFMPLGAPALCVEILEAVERWIADGAL